MTVKTAANPAGLPIEVFDDLRKQLGVPTSVIHGDDHQIVPIAASALLSIELLKNGTPKVYKKLPHGMYTTHADVVNPDMLAVIER